MKTIVTGETENSHKTKERRKHPLFPLSDDFKTQNFYNIGDTINVISFSSIPYCSNSELVSKNISLK